MLMAASITNSFSLIACKPFEDGNSGGQTAFHVEHAASRFKISALKVRQGTGFLVRQAPRTQICQQGITQLSGIAGQVGEFMIIGDRNGVEMPGKRQGAAACSTHDGDDVAGCGIAMAFHSHDVFRTLAKIGNFQKQIAQPAGKFGLPWGARFAVPGHHAMSERPHSGRRIPSVYLLLPTAGRVV
jgi:hypothetical protein